MPGTYMSGDYFDLGNFGQMGPTPPFVPGERTPGTDDAYSGEERSLEDIQAHRRRRPSITDPKYKPGFGRQLAAAAANAATTYVNMGGRTRVPDEPVQRLTGELLAPGYSRDITEWEDQGSALSDDYEIASRRGDISRGRVADSRQAEMDASRMEREGAAAERDRAYAGKLRTPGPVDEPKPTVVGGSVMFPPGVDASKYTFETPERPEDPNALSERDKLEIQHTNRLKEIEARKATTGGGPDPKVLMEVERDRSDRLMRAESAKLKAVAGDDDITPEEMAAVESMYKQQVKIIEEMYEREKQAALGGGAPAIPPNPYRQQAPMPAAPGPPSPTPMRGGMPMGTPNLF